MDLTKQCTYFAEQSCSAVVESSPQMAVGTTAKLIAEEVLASNVMLALPATVLGAAPGVLTRSIPAGVIYTQVGLPADHQDRLSRLLSWAPNDAAQCLYATLYEAYEVLGV